jgi:hypothetical protein
VKEQDRLAASIPRFDDMNPAAAASSDQVVLHIALFHVLACHFVECRRQVVGGCEGKGVAAGSESGDAT